MNQDNYGTLPASQRLQAAGIVIETECFWFINKNWPERNKIINYKPTPSEMEQYIEGVYVIPAPSMAEVWRELPIGLLVNGSWAELFISKREESEFSYCGYRIEHRIIVSREDPNPTDILIDLRIWVEEHKRKENP